MMVLEYRKYILGSTGSTSLGLQEVHPWVYRGLTTHTWGWLVRMSRNQFQREVFSSRVLSLVMSLEGTIVLNAEL
jgi:hypothetical protein